MDNDAVPTTLLQAAIKALMNVFEVVDRDVHLLNHGDLGNKRLQEAASSGENSHLHYNP